MRHHKALFILPLLASLLPAQDTFAIHDGVPVRLRLTRNLSSNDCKEGDTVDFEVLEEVKVGDATVIARGSSAVGTITQAQRKGRMARGGKLDMTIDYARLSDGGKVALRAVKEMRGGGHGGAMTGAIVATALVAWPAAPLFLLMHGKDATIPKGTEITAYINGEIPLDPRHFGLTSAAAAPESPVVLAQAAATGAVLTNEDVLNLRAAGFDDQLLISEITRKKAQFRLEVGDLIRLKQAGLSQAVIAAMMQSGSK